MPPNSNGDDLEKHFPGHCSDARAAAWEAAKTQYPAGSSVRGTVISRQHFGVFLDIGAGFPALLEIGCIADLTPEKYRSDDWCPMGSEVPAFVGVFSNYSRQIGLWQVRPASEREQAAPGA